MKSFKGKEAKKPEHEVMVKHHDLAPGWENKKLVGDANDVGTSFRRNSGRKSTKGSV